jgi:hypothetical protein
MASILDTGKIVSIKTTYEPYPDTGESGETYDVEFFASVAQS